VSQPLGRDRAQLTHHRARGRPVPDHVADHQPEPAARHDHRVEPVTTHGLRLVSGPVAGGEGQIGQHGQGVREQGTLQVEHHLALGRRALPALQ
jgi:hypothetical protein